MWRLLIRLDADLLSTILAHWITHSHPPGRQIATTALPAGHRRRRQTVRGARRADGTQVHLLSVLDISTGIVLAQVTVNAKSNEIPAFTPLLDAVEPRPWSRTLARR
jgi:hypothetical protein